MHQWFSGIGISMPTVPQLESTSVPVRHSAKKDKINKKKKKKKKEFVPTPVASHETP